MHFEVNRGQTDPEVKFLARGRAHTLFLTPDETVLALRQPRPNARKNLQGRRATKNIETGPIPFIVLRMQLVGATRQGEVTGVEPLEGKVHYFHGNDPGQWHTNIPTFAKVRYRNVYPGVDLVYYGHAGELEYDFIVAAGADPKNIRFAWSGVESIDVDASGDLQLRLPGGGHIRWRKPALYQESNGKRRVVSGRFVKQAGGEIGFDVGSYDVNAPLVIDPALIYATYLGGSDDESVSGIAVDNSGNAYAAGDTASSDFPRKNALQSNFGAPSEAYLTKVGPAGTNFVYSTYLGGNNSDLATAVAVDTNGNAYLVGFTDSSNFPTPNGYQSGPQGFGDAFVAKISSNGASLLYASYLGGGNSDIASSVAVDKAGKIYVTGEADSTDFPKKNGFATTYRGGSSDAFVTKIDPAASGSASLLYSTFVGGDDSEVGQAIAVDISSNAYVTGFTFSTNFPTTTGAIQTNLQVFYVDAFVTKVNPGVTGTASLVYSTYLGGYEDENFTSPGSIAVDTSSNAYVVGCTSSTNFPITANAMQTSFYGGICDTFFTKIGPRGTNILYSTYFGGTGNDAGQGIAVLNSSNVFLTGYTSSEDFPVTAGAFQDIFGGGDSDAYVAKLNPNAGAAALIYATFLGSIGDDEGNAIAVDATGNAYIGGGTSTNSFPVTIRAAQTNWAGLSEGFIAKIIPGADLAITTAGTPEPVSLGSSLTYTIAITNFGELAATSVTVTDSLPASVSFVSATPSIGTCSQAGGVVSCNLGTLAFGSDASITIVANAVTPGLVTNIARIFAAQPDSVTNDNIAVAINTAGSLVSITATITNAFEAGPLIGRFRVARTGIQSTALTVNYTVSGTATPGADYAALPGTVTIPSGLNAALITVSPVNDSLTECPETVVLTLVNGAGYAIASPTSATVTIVDNDLPVVTVATTTPSTMEGGSTNAVFTISRAGCTTASLSVNYKMSGVASNGVDFSTLSGTAIIPVGANSVTVSVQPTNDSTVECPEIAVLTISVNAAYIVGSPSSDTVTIFDNDSSVTVVATSPNASEAGTSGLFTFFRTACASVPLTVNYSIGGSAGNGTDYVAISNSFTMAAGITNATVSIRPFADGLNEGNETVVLTVSASSNYRVGTPSSATVNIADNNVPPTANFTGTPTSGLVPLFVTFTDTSVGSIASRTWDFGDGMMTNVFAPSATSITHLYSVEGTYTVSLTVNGSLGTNILSRADYITGTLLPPQQTVTPDSRDFGSLSIGQTNTQTFTVVNTGGGTLSGTATVPAPFVINSGGSYDLTPGKTNTVVVSFIPTFPGAYNADVTFSSNAGTLTKPVTGSALTAGQMQSSPPVVNFGVVLTGQTAQATLVVTNLGGTTITNGMATIAPGPFSVVSGSPFSLSGFGATNVIVRFAPLTGNTFSNTIVFSSANGGTVSNGLLGIGGVRPVASFNAAPTSGLVPLTVTFSDTSTGTITNRFWDFGDGITLNTTAVGVTHLYNVRGTYNVKLIVSGQVGLSTNTQNNLIVAQIPAQLFITPLSRDFGSVTIGQTNTLAFSVINTGDVTLSGTATTAPPYRVASGSPYSINAGQTGTVMVSFLPIAVGSFNTNVIFTSNGGTSTNTLTGAGIAAGQIGVSPATLNFGTKATGTSTQAVFTVTNTGGTTVNGTATVTGGPFTIISGSTFSLTPSASTNVVVQFAPVTAGAFTNSVIFATANDGSSTNVVLGTGALVPVAAFSATPTNGVAPLTVTFTDTSTGTITNRTWNFGDGATLDTAATTVMHTYRAAGSNTVTLIARGPVGVSTNTKPALIVVWIYPPGDVNGTFTVTTGDSLLINQVLAGVRTSNDAIFQTTGYANGDVNQDTAVTGGDSLLINQVQAGLRAYVVTRIFPSSRSNNVPTIVTICGIGFPTNAVTGVTIGPPVNLTLSNVVVMSREQIQAVVPAGGGLGTGTVSVIATPTNGVTSFGKFINQ